jgi:hypothetical protein
MALVLQNPYEPTPVDECISVSDKNYRFAYPVLGSGEAILFIEWKYNLKCQWDGQLKNVSGI